jgi:hypothetical protein
MRSLVDFSPLALPSKACGEFVPVKDGFHAAEMEFDGGIEGIGCVTGPLVDSQAAPPRTLILAPSATSLTSSRQPLVEVGRLWTFHQ